MSRVLANSKFTANLLQDLEVPFDRIDTVAGGVDAKRFRKPILNLGNLRACLEVPNDAFVLLTVCRLVAKKGIELLLQAVEKLRSTIPNVHLVIVGDGKHKKKYEDFACSLGIANSVTFTGRVTHEVVHRYYWCSDVFVLASHTSVNRFTGIKDAETMGRVLCEANAAGIPIVASKSGGTSSIITHNENGLLFAEDDLDALISHIIRLRTKTGLVQRLTRNGLTKAEKEFDWSVILGHHERVFTELLARCS